MQEILKQCTSIQCNVPTIPKKVALQYLLFSWKAKY